NAHDAPAVPKPTSTNGTWCDVQPRAVSSPAAIKIINFVINDVWVHAGPRPNLARRLGNSLRRLPTPIMKHPSRISDCPLIAGPRYIVAKCMPTSSRCKSVQPRNGVAEAVGVHAARVLEG